MDRMFSGLKTGEQARSKNEGELTSQIEKRTAQMPSITFLSLAGAAVVGSVTLLLAGRRSGSSDWAHLVGALIPSFLLLGLYNKLVKEHESVGFTGTEHEH